MKYFTAEWWSNPPSNHEVFDQYTSSLSEIRKRVPQELHWVLGACAFHDGRQVVLTARDFLSIRMSLDVDHSDTKIHDICGRIDIDFQSPSRMAWSSESAAAIARCDPPVDLGYHEFSLTSSGLLRYNAIFDTCASGFSELEVEFESFNLQYTPLDFLQR